MALIVVPEDEVKTFNKLGFFEPCQATKEVAERHKNEIPEGEVLLVFKPPNFQIDNYGPIPKKKQNLISDFAKEMKQRMDEFKKQYTPQLLDVEMEKLKKLHCY